MNMLNQSATTETVSENEITAQNFEKLQEIKTRNFTPADMENAEKAIQEVVEVCAANGIEPVFNFDTDSEFPAGYGISIIPLTKRVTGSGNVVEGVCIAAVPSVDSILETAGGVSWVYKQITTKLVNAIKSAATSGEDGGINSLPMKVDDFISSTRTSALEGFNAVASTFVKALREKGLKFINKPLLRQILSSQAFAEQQYPIPADKWEMVIKSMIAHAEKEGKDAGIMAHWLKTRNEVEIDVAEIDLSGLDEIIDGSDDE